MKNKDNSYILSRNIFQDNNFSEKEVWSKSQLYRSPNYNFSSMNNLISEYPKSKKTIGNISSKAKDENIDNEILKDKKKQLKQLKKYIEYLKNELNLSYKGTQEIDNQLNSIKKKSEDVLNEREKIKNNIEIEKKIRDEILKENEMLKIKFLNCLVNSKNHLIIYQNKINEINKLIQIQGEKNFDYEKRNEELRKAIENKEKLVSELQEKIKKMNISK